MPETRETAESERERVAQILEGHAGIEELGDGGDSPLSRLLRQAAALLRATPASDGGEVRERLLREAIEQSVGVFRRACEIAEAAMLAGETPKVASARLREAIESDIAEINALVALAAPPEDSQETPGRDLQREMRTASYPDELIDGIMAIHDYAHDHSTGPAVPDALWEIREMAADLLAALRSAPTTEKGVPILLYDSIGTGWVTPDNPLHSDHDRLRSAPTVQEGDPAPEGANCMFRCPEWCGECAHQETMTRSATSGEGEAIAWMIEFWTVSGWQRGVIMNRKEAAEGLADRRGGRVVPLYRAAPITARKGESDLLDMIQASVDELLEEAQVDDHASLARGIEALSLEIRATRPTEGGSDADE